MSQPSPNPDHPHQANTPEEIIFDNNIREFTAKIEHVCGLEQNGKISQREAYRRIRDLWKQLKKSKKNLGIGEGSHGDGI
jgi:transcriptional regulator with AAA-type ATPase domain